MYLNANVLIRLTSVVLCGWLLVGCASLADVELPRFTPVPTIGRLPSVTPVPPATNTPPPTPTSAVTSTPTPPTAIVTVGANVRAGPSTRFKIAGSIPEGSEVILISSSDNWYEIRTQDGSLTGWMIADVLDIPEERAALIPTVTPAP